MSQFSIFSPTKATMKLANGNTENAQGTGINLCNFYYCSTVYPVGPVYYFPVHPSNTISSGALRFYVGSQNVTSTPLEIFDFVDPQGHSWRSTYQTQNNIDYIQIKNFKVKTQINRNIVVPTVYALLTISLRLFISALIMSLLTGSKERQKKDPWRVYQKISLTWKNPDLFVY